MTTLRDLSRHLNLSVTQISRALNGYSDVSEDTRQRVEKAAKDLNYHPNVSARRLVTGRSGVVGLVMPTIPEAPRDSLFVQIVGGLSAHFSRRGMQFILHVADGEGDIVNVYRRLIDGGSLDGFVLLEPEVDDPRITFLRGRGVPFVVHGRHTTVADHPYFDIDNDDVAYRLTACLTARGHRRIAFLNGRAGRTYVEWRHQGYLRALADAGVMPHPGWHLTDEMTEGFGLLGTMRLLDGPGPHPTAIVCGNTLIARGVFRTLSAMGLSVPGDVSVVAHDDELPGVRMAGFEPALTGTHSPLAFSWEPLAALLVEAIDRSSRLDLEGLQRFGEVSFVQGGSVGPPRD
ncbi:MAG: substrate-binding domain-containing protein [Rubellimicrobium sp.]|nr:substrate-binding domain-containing protein [Rubellimicrobium sp.]